MSEGEEGQKRLFFVIGIKGNVVPKCDCVYCYSSSSSSFIIPTFSVSLMWLPGLL